MKVEIVEKDTLVLLGMVYYGDPFHEVQGWSDENEIGRLWGRFNRYWEDHKPLWEHAVDPDVAYEVHVSTDEYDETGEYYVMVGVEVDNLASMPPVSFAKILPSGSYAVFTLTGEELVSNWSRAIYEAWLPNSDYEEALPFTVERYDARFSGPGDPDSVLEIHVPVKPK